MANSSNAIIVHNKKLLLLLRDNFPGLRDANKWSLIGGGIDSGENHEEALYREIKEEISIEPSNVQYLGKVKTQNGVHAIYFVKLNDKEVSGLELGDEGQKIEFFSIDEMSELELSENLQGYFNKYHEYLKKVIESSQTPDPEDLGLH